ncbi:MAG: DUF5667 domain-containing protein [Candidatus Spechtbacterales bacterium]
MIRTTTQKLHKNLARELKEQSLLIGLSQEEKDAFARKLELFMVANPVRSGEDLRLTQQRTLGVFYQLIRVPKPMPLVIILAVVATVTAGGGAAYAAQDTLPGERLYDVKLHVNERFEGLLAISDEDEAELALELAERRIRESERLAERKELSAELAQGIEARLASHVQRLEALSVKLEERGLTTASTNVRIRLAAMLELHNKVLAEMEEGNGLQAREVARIRSAIQLNSTFVAQAREHMEERFEEQEDAPRKIAAERAQASATAKLERTKAYFADHEHRLHERVKLVAAELIASAEGSVSQGNLHMENAAYGDAYTSFNAAIHDLQTAASLMATSLRLTTDLRLNNAAQQQLQGGDSQDNETTDTRNMDEQGVNLNVENGAVLKLPVPALSR